MKTKLSIAFHVIYALFFIYVLGNVFVAYTAQGDGAYIIIGTAALLLLTAGAVFLTKKKMPVISDKSINQIYACVSLVMLALQIYLVFRLKTVQNADAYAVFKAADNYAHTGSWDNMYQGIEKITHYFERYPNNWSILVLLGWFLRIVYLIIGEVPIVAPLLLNVVLIQAANFFVFKTSKLIFKSNSKVLLCILIMFTCSPLYTYSTFVYTDTIGLPFVTGAVYFILRISEASGKKQTAVYTGAAALFIAVGYSIKGSIAVIFVAAIIYLFINSNWKKALAACISFGIAFVFINTLLLNTYVSKSGIIDKNELDTYRFPATHWVMMGLMGDGRFNEQARRYTYYQPDYEAKKEANIKEIKRLLQQPKSVLIDHFNKKVQLTWSDGRYRVMHYLAKAKPCSAKYMIIKGKNFYRYAQIYNIIMLLSMFISVISGIVKKEKSHMFLIRLSVFGLSLFLLMWETTPRYLFNFIPLFLLMETDGLCSLFKLFKKLSAKLTLKTDEVSETV